MKTLRNRKYKYSRNKKGRKTIKNKKNKKKSIKNQLGGNVNQFISRIHEICNNIDINLVKNNLQIIKKTHPRHYKIIKKAVLELKDYINIGQIILLSLNKKDINKLNKISKDDISNFLKSTQLGGGMGDLIPILILIVGLLFLASKFGLFSLSNMFGNSLNKSKKGKANSDDSETSNESDAAENSNSNSSSNSNSNSNSDSNSNSNSNSGDKKNKSNASKDGGNWGELLTSALTE